MLQTSYWMCAKKPIVMETFLFFADVACLNHSILHLNFDKILDKDVWFGIWPW